MSIVLTVNKLIRYGGSSDNPEILRVLYLDNTEDIAYVINIYGDKGLPVFCRPTSLIEDLEIGKASIVAKDPWATAVKDDELSDSEKHLRNEAWKVISDLVAPSNEPAIFDRNKRGELFEEAGKNHGAIPITVYKYMRRYWQRGKTKNALIPDFQNSGGKGKERKAGEVKRGRKRKFQDVEDIGEGVNVDESMKKIFRTAVSKFYHDPKEMSLKDAFNLMIAEYFTEETVFDGNGVKRNILIPPEKRPTLAQFHYWFNKERDVEKDITARRGKNAYALTSRPLLSNATSQVIGPGHRFEIDATVADTYLISRYNPLWIIGRPVIYILIDIFSRLIAGLYIGLEGPSWIGAMMALANCVADKREFCAEYGITISEDDWPCHHLPFTLLGDGGEIAGINIESLAANLNVRVETAAVGRGDLKPIVERNFRTIKEKVKPFLPGQVIPDAHKRRGIDYRLDARLNIHQFTRIIIDGILQHNKSYLGSYSRDEMMIAADVQPIPNELWQWGIRNRTGRLNTFPEDIVKLNLLPYDYGRITRSGIIFKKMKYSCERAIKEGWFVKGSDYESERVKVAYDLRKPNYIYLKSADGRSFEKCYLLSTEEKYMNKDLYEIEYLHEYEELARKRSLPQAQQNFADHAALVKDTVAEAELKFDEVFDPTVSNSGRIADIVENRKLEKMKRREEEAFELGKDELPDRPANVIPINPNISVRNIESLDYPDELDILSRSRKRKKETQTDE